MAELVREREAAAREREAVAREREAAARAAAEKDSEREAGWALREAALRERERQFATQACTLPRLTHLKGGTHERGQRRSEHDYSEHCSKCADHRAAAAWRQSGHHKSDEQCKEET